MKFTKEAWENAPEGATLKYGGCYDTNPVYLVGFDREGNPVIEGSSGTIFPCKASLLRIVLPKRKVTVQLWRGKSGIFTATTNEVEADVLRPEYWTLLGEHTFEIEEE